MRLFVLTLGIAVVCSFAADSQDPPEKPVVPMRDRLAAIYAAADPLENDFMNRERVAGLYRQLQTLPQGPERLRHLMKIAREELRAGLTNEALEHLLEIRAALPERPPDSQSALLDYFEELLAVAHLRKGEADNCLAHCSSDSCLFPIRGAGVHTRTAGSRAAIAAYTKLLQRTPDSLSSRWLLNLAAMTVGGHPHEVPAQWRIDASRFLSQREVGKFPNVALTLGLDDVGLAGGSVMDDLDGDGDLDLMTSSWGHRDPLRLYRNEGNGKFTEVAAAAGLDGIFGGLNLCHADYDNDGDVDVFVLRGAWWFEEGRIPNSLLENQGDGTFRDVTERAGLLSFHPTQTAAWADYDGDGKLDLFIGNETTGDVPHPCELYRNRGDGTFTDVAAAAGVAHIGFVKGVAWGDYDDDGRPDLYLSKLGEPNILFRNEGAKFRDVTATAGVSEPSKSFPTWFFDYDNDGRLDLLAAPYDTFRGFSLDLVVADYLGEKVPGAEYPRLFRNRGDGSFEDVTEKLGLDSVLLAMGANFGDLDNDGWLDFYVGTGQPNLRCLVPNRMFRNDSGERFQDVTTSGGFGHLQKGHGISFGDLDGDGDQDILAVLGGAYSGDVFPNALFRNPGHGNAWILLRLRGTRSNRCAIGARVTITCEGPSGRRAIHRVVGTGGSFGSSSLQLEVGLGRADSITDISVRWPGGKQEVFTGFELNAGYALTEGNATPRAIEVPGTPPR